jgi:hypothetical protein
MTGAQDDRPPADPDGLAETIRVARAEFARVQKLIRSSERGEQRIRKHGKDPGPELAEGRVRLEEMLDQLAGVIGRAEAMLAARGAARDGASLTTAQAEHFLQGIGAGDRLTALYRDKPEETTAMLNNMLTQIEGPFETRLGYIVMYMRQV